MDKSFALTDLFRSLPEYAKTLDEEAFDLAFDSFWQRMSRRFFKLERLQFYNEPEDLGYQAFLAGDVTSAIHHLENRIAAQEPLYLKAVRENLSIVRVRAAEMPLTTYLRYELDSYRISARYGERILVTDISKHNTPKEFINSQDYLLFDSFAVLVNRYDENCRANGAWLVDNPEYVALFEKLAEKFIASSVPLGVFERENSLS